MTYTVQQLANLAGISVRTLHYYDEVGLLKPAKVEKNGYRQYGETELLRLQQILFFRELDFSLDQIKAVLNKAGFDMKIALLDQKRLIELKKKRLTKLIKTIETTLIHLDKKQSMEDIELYSSFNTDEIDQYAEEAKRRWGNTEAYKQSVARTKHFTKADYARLAEEGDRFMKHLAEHMSEGPTSAYIQTLIGQHYHALRTFYEPNLELYRGLANMYVDDPRFAAYYQKYHPDMPVFMREAMLYFADTQEKK